MFTKFSDFSVEHVKSILLLCGIFLAFAVYICRRNNLFGLEKKINYALGIAALTSFFAFYNFGFFHFGGGHYHTHDLYHYYMGSKYFNETGYLYLYDATILADEEANNYMKPAKRMRNQTDYSYLPREAAHDPERLKHWQLKFTPERWAEFKRDLVWFQAHPHGWQWWEGIVGDFGYNPSPVWTMIASVISNAIPTSFEAGMIFIAYLDGILAVLMFWCIARAFGLQTMLFSMLFWGSTFTFVFSFTGASMLRHDWIVYMVMAICLLKMDKPLPAALFFVLSAYLRIFPVLFIFPVAAAFIIKTIKEKKIDWLDIDWLNDWKKLDRSMLIFFLSALGFGIFIFLLTLLTVAGDWGSWPDFIDKMKTHKGSWNTWNWGFIDIFIYSGEVYDNLPGNWKEAKTAQLQNLLPLTVFLRAATVALLAWAASRLEYWESLCLGGLMIFMFINPTKYYFVHLITLLPLLSYKPGELWRVRGIAGLFGIMIMMFVINMFNTTAILLQFAISLTIYLLYLFVLFSICKESGFFKRIKNV